MRLWPHGLRVIGSVRPDELDIGRAANLVGANESWRERKGPSSDFVFDRSFSLICDLKFDGLGFRASEHLYGVVMSGFRTPGNRNSRFSHIGIQHVFPVSG
jgi:hypothetical protein